MLGKKDRAGAGQPKPRLPRLCVLDPLFREDMEWWMSTKPAVARKLPSLIDAALRDPFDGIGKPEPLKQLGPNIWSRRVTGEPQMVYVVFDDRIAFVQGRYHY
jgi:toxin YoeB